MNRSFHFALSRSVFTPLVLALGVVTAACSQSAVPIGTDTGNDAGNTRDAHVADSGPTHLACTSNQDCSSTQYCANSGCDPNGPQAACQERPGKDACTEIDQPVCGCDQTTYPNACAAAQAGINIYAYSACGAATDAGASQDAAPDQHVTTDASQACGQAVCGPQDYCATSSCDPNGPQAACQARPTTCPGTGSPVCGCDQVTYPNACEAAAAGVSIALQGPC